MQPGPSSSTGRGALVDHEALVEALSSRRLGGAGQDVFRQEPVPADDPLLTQPTVLLSPHVTGASDRALEMTALAVASAVLQAARGHRPRHVIATPRGECR
jgi:phosphoglycerate dehydrogenase-like enzyme